MKVFALLRNLVFPPKCIICKKVLPISKRRPNVCKSCSEKLFIIPVSSCKKCGRVRDVSFNKPYCLFCASQVSGIKGLVAPFIYRNETREAILRFKFGNKPYYAASFAYFIKDRIDKYNLTDSIEAVVPVPISAERKRERGYNQSFLLAKYLSRQLKVPLIDCLNKIKDTKPQSTLKFSERRTNLKGSMELKPDTDLPKTVLLLDDVYTTGSTAGACAKLLKKAGANEVLVSTVAVNLIDEFENDEE